MPTMQRERIRETWRPMGRIPTLPSRPRERVSPRAPLLRRSGQAAARVDFVERGIGYAQSARGVIAVDGSGIEGDEPQLRSDTVALAFEVFARNKSLRRVALPEGLTVIGEGAFRGCPNLTSIALPSTLVEVGAGAFACTAIRSLHVPAACVRLAEDALCTGPVFPGSVALPYSSALRAIAVDAANPSYTVQGGVLCRRMADGALEALLCPGDTDEVALPSQVARIAPGTFAGTTRIGTLRVPEGLGLPDGEDPAFHGSCERIIVDLAYPREGSDCLSLGLPSGVAGSAALRAAFSGDRLRVEELILAADEAVERESDELSRARHIAARLAAPVGLSPECRDRFRALLAPAVVSACVHFGARSEWKSLDNLVGSGLLNETNIADAIAALTRFGNTLAAGHVLELRRRCFGEVLKDYGL